MENPIITSVNVDTPIPWFGARKVAADLQIKVRQLNGQLLDARTQLAAFNEQPEALKYRQSIKAQTNTA